MLESDAREQRGLDVDDRHLAGAEGHAHGAARRFGIDQRVHHERIRAGARALDPEGAEERELLAAGLGRPQGQRPRDEAEALAAGERPEEARALHERELDRLAARLGQGGGEQAKPGIGDVAEVRRHVELAELEAAPFIGDPAHALVLDGEQEHRAREDPAAMQRLDHEAAALAGPDLRLRQRPDADILLVIQVRERFRQVGGHRRVGALGERAGELDDGGRLEALAFAERRLDLRQYRRLRQGGRRRERPERGAADQPQRVAPARRLVDRPLRRARARRWGSTHGTRGALTRCSHRIGPAGTALERRNLYRRRGITDQIPASRRGGCDLCASMHCRMRRSLGTSPVTKTEEGRCRKRVAERRPAAAASPSSWRRARGRA